MDTCMFGISQDGRTPLHHVQSRAMVEKLVLAGAKVNAADEVSNRGKSLV